MKSSVELKIGSITVLFVVFIALGAAITSSILDQSRGDAKVINLAGRQRMLSQKMTKEALATLRGETSGRAESEQRHSLRATADLFDRSLRGLISGDERLGLPPQTDREALRRLSVVQQQWERFRPRVEQVAEGGAEYGNLLRKLAEQNTQLLTAMDQAVTLMSRSSRDASPMQVNLAGRQRMLTQKLTKELLLTAMGLGDPAAARATATLFDRTLKGLLKGDPALELAPARDGEVIRQLEAVQRLWVAFHASVDRLSVLGTELAAAGRYLLDNNLAMLDAMNEAVSGLEQLAEGRVSRIGTYQRGILIGAILLAIISFVMARRLVVKPLQALTQVSMKIARDGDLTQPIELSSEDEVGQLAAAFAQMVGRLKEMVGNLRESAHSLGETGQTLGTAAGEQSVFANRQAAALQQTQVTAQEIKQTSALAASKAASVIEAAERAEEVGRSGEQAVERSLTALEEIRNEVGAIAKSIDKLQASARQVGDVTLTVKDLADQSNMLALNAAIEAVRSGEHGKGFAVVASEFRSLADQSLKATQEVRERLDGITDAVRRAVSSAEAGAHRIEGGLLEVRASGDNLRDLAGMVKQTSDAVRQIAAAVRQQDEGLGQIFSAVSDQSSMMSETVKRLDSTARTAAALRERSSSLAEATRRFVIDRA